MANESKKEREEKKAALRAQLEALRLEAEAEKQKEEEDKRKEIEAAKQKLIDDAAALKRKEEELKVSATEDGAPPEKVVEPEVMSKNETYQMMTLAASQALAPRLEELKQSFRDEIARAKQELKEGMKEGAKEGISEGITAGLQSEKGQEALRTVAKEIKKGQRPMIIVIVGALCLLMIGCGLVVRQMVKENRAAIKGLADSQLGGTKDLVKDLKIMMGKLGKNQTTSSVVSSSDNHSKEKGVSAVNYSTKTLKIFKVKVDGNGNVITDKDGKRLAKFITAVNGGFTRTVYFDDSDGRSRLIAVGDGIESEPQEFSDSMWIWKFDDVSNPKGLKTRDTAFVPKQ